ncbi:hypothetical protein H3C66_01770 [Patescibacteria group bacterium]|nr:hypothetical protein [Patescibacteria group bacterium]
MENTPISLVNFFSYFEDINSQVAFSVLNNLTSFIIRLEYSSIFSEAKNTVTSNPELYGQVVVDRANLLLRKKTVKKYRNKYDNALAGYLLLLSESSILHLRELVKTIQEKNLPNFWWTNFMLNYVVESKLSTSSDVFNDAEINSNVPQRFTLLGDQSNLGTVTHFETVNIT